MILFLFLILFSIATLVLFNVHYLIILLSIEMILLSTSFFLFIGWFVGSNLISLFLFFLLMACMGGFSVSLLVSLFREMGRDFWFGSTIL